eukprot:CAMPEP_0195523030 /NCGR_PEP_ID=MMETSP0794_2-20130614/21770_1 /TAXON_ID=515487 /ORGANISM="Stephanopyxis turris, Strain CCMP 815" /LENGTH=323 /DNA_ID=CAMNT_0040652929 /DNA_START=224 /DNA_END=1195 /DNA_ORIENTATION=+
MNKHWEDDDEDDDFNDYDPEEKKDRGSDETIFSSDWVEDEEGNLGPAAPSLESKQSTPWKKNARWNSLNPKVKMRLIQERQQIAIEKKKRKEPSQDKKRRLMMLFKKSQLKNKKNSRVKRKMSLTDEQRIPLSSLTPGMKLDGQIISMTNFGAYVDVGTECDGLLHISQISREIFVEHPKEVFRPGDEVSVTVSRASPELKKLQLTMLPPKPEIDEDDETDLDRITLEEIDVDDELWGEIKRVTDYGAYVELGAEEQGFLHFMDHPSFGLDPDSPHPSTFMKIGQRVRVWVTDVDVDRSRIKLTGNRPASLPQLRRELGRTVN